MRWAEGERGVRRAREPGVVVRRIGRVVGGVVLGEGEILEGEAGSRVMVEG